MVVPILKQDCPRLTDVKYRERMENRVANSRKKSESPNDGINDCNERRRLLGMP